MKIYNLLFAATAITLAACSDNDYTELDKGSTELALEASLQEVTLLETDHASEAISLQWTSGTNYGTGNRISYTLVLQTAGGNYTVKSAVQQDYSWTPSVEALNTLLLEQLGGVAGQSMAVEAHVTATVANLDGIQEAFTQFVATPYKPVTTTLYLIGDATPNGWSADNATEMTRTDNGVFTWTGNLTTGDLKFITTLGSFLPSYNNDGAGNLTLRTSDDQADEKFHIDEAHCYQVDVNLLTLTAKLTQVAGVTPPYTELFFVGNENDWGFWPMQQDLLDPFLFRFGYLPEKGGEFKFGTSEGSWENMYKSATANASYTSTAVEFVKGFDPDNKWYLNADECGKYYKICLDIRPGSERMMMREFTPYACIYLVGDATPGGWSLGDATPMAVDASDPCVLTWSGHLTAGELKFSCDCQSDWNGAWFLASEGGKAPDGTVERTLFIDKSDNSFMDQYLDIMVGGIDQKWQIGEAGDYTITLNQLLEEVTIAKN